MGSGDGQGSVIAWIQGSEVGGSLGIFEGLKTGKAASEGDVLGEGPRDHGQLGHATLRLRFYAGPLETTGSLEE